MLLVYELMPNGNMQDALLHRKCPELMNWKQRFSIAVDIAKGLDYLHGLDPPIMHGDIKPTEYYGSVAETDSVATGIDEFRLAIDQSPVSVTVTESLLNAEAVTVAASPESLSVSPEMMEKGSVSEGNLSVLESGGKGIKSSSGSDWWRKQDNVAALVESGKVKDNGLDPFYGVFRSSTLSVELAKARPRGRALPVFSLSWMPRVEGASPGTRLCQLSRHVWKAHPRDAPSIKCGCKLEHVLISALIERWRPETHTFHLPCGEATITLEDVSMHLGLPVDENMMCGMADDDWQSMCIDYLGAAPPEFNGGRIALSWLKANFEVLNENASEDQTKACARAYILRIIGVILMPDKYRNQVHCMWLRHLIDFDEAERYSWGAAVLAFLFREMCRATNYKKTAIGGCLLLLQSWAWFRMPFLCPIVNEPYVFPLLLRWSMKRKDHKSIPTGLEEIRLLIDTKAGSEFQWIPYASDEVKACIPPHLSGSLEYGCTQYIPGAPRNLDDVHNIDRRGKKDVNWVGYMPSPPLHMPSPPVYMPSPQGYIPSPQGYTLSPQGYIPSPPDHYIPLTLKRNITIEELITKISLKIRVAGQRRLSSLQYRFPTELFPLTYTSFQLSNDDDVSMMVDAHMGSSQSLIEMYATFIEVRATRGLSYSSHFGIAYQTDQVDSPTQLICNDFTSLMADPTPYTMPSSSIGRHSSATAYDLNPRGFTNNPYGNISSTSRGRHSSANVFDLHMEMPTRRQSIHIPHDTMASSSRGGHASENLFDLNIGLSEEPSSPPEEPLREPDLPDVGNYGLQSSVNDGNLHIGMEFASNEEAMMAIKSYNIRNSVQSRVDRSNTEKYVCYCVQRDNGCQWMVRVSKRKRKNNLWELSRYNGPHTCCATGINQDHPNLDSNIICQAIMPIVKQSSHIAVAVLISTIQSQYGYTVSYKKAWLAKQNAICKLHGEWDSSYNELPSWVHVVQRLNPGTIVEFETQHHYVNDRMVHDRCQFYRVFWTYPQCINAVKYCKPIVQIDGTFLYGKYKQVLLLAVVQDGNRNILPVAFALVQGEDTESWAFFLKNLRLHVITRERVCIISDRGAGIKAAMDSLGTMYRPPHVQHRYCVRHIAANYYGKYKKNDERQLVVLMGYELLPQRFESMLQELFGKNKKGCEYIMDISKEMWTNVYDGGYRYGHMTTNLAETINSTLKGHVIYQSRRWLKRLIFVWVNSCKARWTSSYLDAKRTYLPPKTSS
ncbi:hypothetical protein F3Y22_tig00110300pilonHSYRG00045 [Hibiscus syriacus]|uniref:Protein kinase domain-containing protein n=1 Tax=Hibiscus syriacus TaxID=106335 RepID=A0A6A3B5S6_HIBSY|nr:hypothetical protein F3Y22_tig00110300pilonHSYRG00045 [Hibiscus syriacus]